MNRTRTWTALFAMLGILWPGASLRAEQAATPLVVGAVRDQRGNPIAGAAVVDALRPGARLASTEADGTFSFRASTVSAVRISCPYCRDANVPVSADKTVVAIVHRYEAISSAGLTTDDVASLPYGHAESLLSLQPFIVLEDSANVLPGPRVSDRGLSNQGGLLLDNGIPNYDISANVTTFRTLPTFGVARLDFIPPSQAFRYGDQAGGGTFATDPGGAYPAHATIIGGDDAAFSTYASGESSSFAAAFSKTALESRQRFDAATALRVGEDVLAVNALASRGNLQASNGNGVAESFSGLRAVYARQRNHLIHGVAIVDRGTYAAQRRFSPILATWSDILAEAGTESPGALKVFEDVGFRSSAGLYDATPTGLPRVAATLAQTHADAGLHFASERLDVEAGIGAFDTQFNGGAFGFAQPMRASVLAPSLHARLWPNDRFSAEVTAATAFRLRTFLEAYGYGADEPTLIFDLQRSTSATLAYTDLKRFRIEFTAAGQRVSGLDNGRVSAAGLGIRWQISPELAIRAWSMHFDDRTKPYEPVPRFGAPPRPATIGSVWLTFETASAFRVDAIYRTDLIDYRADRHFDASASAPLARGIRWFAGTERRHGARFSNVGVRFFR